jgi:Xaa-Pro aminopeptidase
MAELAMKDRLLEVRRQMEKMGVDLVIVRSTDRFLNEYVPTDESARVWITGFTGSMGEVVITPKQAFLAVDGRYWIQAEQQVDPKQWEVIKVRLGTGLDQAIAEIVERLVREAAPSKLRVGFEPERVTPSVLQYLQRTVGEGPTWKPLFPSPVEQARGANRPTPKETKIRLVDEKKVGRTVAQKLEELGTHLKAIGADAILVQRLDEIAYLSNLRGDELPYQATFKAIALATAENLFIGIDPARAPNMVRVARDQVLFVPEAEFWTLMGKKSKRKKIAYDPSSNTEQARLAIERTGAESISITTPLSNMKAKKNPAELKSMIEAFEKADRVVDQAASWLQETVVGGDKATEADFAKKVEELFLASGATGLSFRVISAAGKNGAIIHYSDPSPRRVIKKGELMLLDTGAYYAEGYATDLTRTFLVDGSKAKGTAEQQRYYTLVLKSAIAGMTATIPVGASGAALDAIVRAPLWAEGLNYNHGTGHGVGINVHEFPPRIGPNGATTLEVGHVFSIEPGVYLPSFGGIRIENLCTLEAHPKLDGFMRVRPLTFSPLDKRLIDEKLLTASEKAFVAEFGKGRGPTKAKAKA